MCNVAEDAHPALGDAVPPVHRNAYRSRLERHKVAPATNGPPRDVRRVKGTSLGYCDSKRVASIAVTRNNASTPLPSQCQLGGRHGAFPTTSARGRDATMRRDCRATLDVTLETTWGDGSHLRREMTDTYQQKEVAGRALGRCLDHEARATLLPTAAG